MAAAMAATMNENIDAQSPLGNDSSSASNDLVSVNSVATAEPTATVHTLTTRNYNLNINRALKRKLQGCEQVNVEYEVKGGGVTGTLDTASFELFRLACTEFFRTLSLEEGRCVINYSEDKNRKALVQQTYKVTSTSNERCYTLNLYPTNNTLLLNGKDYRKFIEEHLPTIHQIMCNAVQEQNIGSVANFNQILQCQLQKVLDERASVGEAVHASPVRSPSAKQLSENVEYTDCSASPGERISERGGQDRKEDKICWGCKRRTMTRGALCAAGSHWIHFRCDRLSDHEIDRLNNDPGFIYVCKICAKQRENTALKVPVTPATNSSGSYSDSRGDQSHLVLPAISSTNDEGTSASGILEEEVVKDCHVCRLKISEQGNRCDLCQYECHDQCMKQNDDDNCICLSCAATQNQIELNSRPASSQPPTHGQDPQDLQPLGLNCVANKVHSDIGSSVDVNQEQHTAASTKGESSDTGVSASTGQCNGVRVKDKTKSSDSVSVKQRDLRQREAKIKKREEELDMQEAKFGTKGDDSRRLEDYLQKTEARNVELEATIRTLQRKICLLEKESPSVAMSSGPPGVNRINYSQSNGPDGHLDHSQTNFINRYEDPMNKLNCELMRGIHKQVTSFVLKKVAQQISCLESQTGMMQNQQQFAGHNNMNVHVHNQSTDNRNGAAPVLNPNFNPSFNQTFYPYINSIPTPNGNPQHVNQRQSADRQYCTAQQRNTVDQHYPPFGQYSVSNSTQGENPSLQTHQYQSNEYCNEPMRYYVHPNWLTHQTTHLTNSNLYNQQQPNGHYQLGTVMQADCLTNTTSQENKNGSSYKCTPPMKTDCEQPVKQGQPVKNLPRQSGLGSHGRSAARGIMPKPVNPGEIDEANGIAHNSHTSYHTQQVGNRNVVAQACEKTTQSAEAKVLTQSTGSDQLQNHRQQQGTAQDSLDNTNNLADGPLTVGGDPIFYKGNRRGGRRPCPDQSFLYRARPRRGRL